MAANAVGSSYKQSAWDDRWDVIVIGSGIGGMAAAALLAKHAGRRVLVLERHYVAGGFTQNGWRRHRFLCRRRIGGSRCEARDAYIHLVCATPERWGLKRIIPHLQGSSIDGGPVNPGLRSAIKVGGPSAWASLGRPVGDQEIDAAGTLSSLGTEHNRMTAFPPTCPENVEIRDLSPWGEVRGGEGVTG